MVLSSKRKTKDITILETPEELLTRVAYVDYKRGKMESAIKYFNQLGDISTDYVPHLYISYANQYLYETTGKKKFFKKSIDSARTAQMIAPEAKEVMVQLADLKEIYAQRLEF